MRTLFVLVLIFFAQEKSFAKLVPDSTFSPKVDVPTFRSKHPNLCFDQGHMNLGPGDGRHDPVLNLLKSDGYQITVLKAVIDAKTLQACQVFYVSATMANSEMDSGFNSQEIEVIKSWVEQGGALLLMTDHPMILATAPQKLASAFGVSGSLKTVEDPNHTVIGLNDPTVISFSKKEMNNNSAIVLGRNKNEKLKMVMSFTGQSLQGPKNSETILHFSDQAVESTKEGKKTSAKGLSAMIALKFGKGRVVVTGDGTFFSSKLEDEKNERYGINRPGTDNVQMALNTFHWLSKIL